MLKKKLSFIALLLTFLVYSYIHICLISKTHDIKPRLESIKPSIKPKLAKIEQSLTHAEYCTKHSEWIKLSQNVYSKKDFHFYFIDEAKFRGFIVCRLGSTESFAIKLDIYNRNGFIMSYETDLILNVPWFVDEYGHASTYADFDLKKILNTKTELSGDISVNVSYLNKQTKEYSKQYAKLKIKYLRPRSENEYASRKSALLCTKSLYLAKNQHNELNWWIEINKRIGYTNLAIYNNSIPSTPQFNRVLSQNKEFIQLVQLKCIPNFLNSQKEYLEFYEELTYSIKMDVISGVVINECYLENVDKYKYIAIMDNDETVIPSRISDINTFSKYVEYFKTPKTNPVNSLKCENGANKFDSFIEFVVDASKITEPMSYNFDQGFFLKYKLVDILFEEINKMKLFDHLNKSGDDFNAKIHIKNMTYALYDPNQEAFNYVITMSNKGELRYAYNIFKLYNSVIKPYLDKNEKILRKYCNKFDRLLKMIESQNDVHYGKTIHNTKTTLYLTLHEPLGSNFKKIPLEYAHLSHFRSFYHVGEEEPLPISITQIQIDFSYFLCYFKPILKKMIDLDKN